MDLGSLGNRRERERALLNRLAARSQWRGWWVCLSLMNVRWRVWVCESEPECAAAQGGLSQWAGALCGSARDVPTNRFERFKRLVTVRNIKLIRSVTAKTLAASEKEIQQHHRFVQKEEWLFRYFSSLIWGWVLGYYSWFLITATLIYLPNAADFLLLLGEQTIQKPLTFSLP